MSGKFGPSERPCNHVHRPEAGRNAGGPVSGLTASNEVSEQGDSSYSENFPKDGWRAEIVEGPGNHQVEVGLRCLQQMKEVRYLVIERFYNPNEEQLGELQRLKRLWSGIASYLNAGGCLEQLSSDLNYVFRQPDLPEIAMEAGFYLRETGNDEEGYPYHIFVNAEGDALYWIEDLHFERTTIQRLEDQGFVLSNA